MTAAALIREGSARALGAVRSEPDPAHSVQAAIAASVLDYGCPECGADAGKTCRTSGRGAVTRPHMYRRFIAESGWVLSHPTTFDERKIEYTVELLCDFGWTEVAVDHLRPR